MIGNNNNNNIIIPSVEVTDMDDANNNNIATTSTSTVSETIVDDLLPQMHHCSSNHENTNVLCLSNGIINLFEIPISQLGQRCRRRLSINLNLIKVILSENGVQRDWRGVLHYLNLESMTLGYLQSRNDPMGELLDEWQRDCEDATMGELQRIIGEIDRWDVVDDTSDMFGNYLFLGFFFSVSGDRISEQIIINCRAMNGKAKIMC